MNHAALDSMALEKLLLMEKELRVVLPLPRNSDDDMSSLQIARILQTNLDLRDKPTAVAAQPPLVLCAGTAGCPTELEEPGSLAAAAGLLLASLPHHAEMYGGGAPQTCYECERRGHFTLDCWRRKAQNTDVEMCLAVSEGDALPQCDEEPDWVGDLYE
ncbi:unnamed protein product [Lampetra fluviatilis]